MNESSSAPIASLARPTGAIKTSGLSRLRVRYCECDPMNVAHHAAYIPWLEIGRTELLRECGVTYREMEAAGVFLVVVKLDVRYRRPIVYDDLVEIRTRWIGGSKIKIEHEYEVVVVERGGREDGTTAAVASSTLACVDREGKVRVLPDWLVTRPG
jgi:acyl-CoA thioester hydrolase